MNNPTIHPMPNFLKLKSLTIQNHTGNMARGALAYEAARLNGASHAELAEIEREMRYGKPVITHSTFTAEFTADGSYVSDAQMLMGEVIGPVSIDGRGYKLPEYMVITGFQSDKKGIVLTARSVSL